MSSQWLQRIALGVVALGLLSAVAYRFIHASAPGPAGAAEAEPGAQAAAGPEATQPAPARLSSRPTISAEAAAWFSPARALERLGSLQFTNNAQRAAGIRTVIQQLENLVEAGPAAIPAIREFLRQGKNVTLSGRGEGLIPATLRIGLFEVLQRIGGPEAEAALAEVLKAKALWLEAARAEGRPVPPPLFRPAIYKVA